VPPEIPPPTSPRIVVSSTIRTPRLVLRPFSVEDIDDLYAIQSEPEVARYLYWNPRSRAEVAEELARRVRRTAIEREGDYIVLAVGLPHSNTEPATVIGDLTLWLRSAEHRQGEVGFVLNPEHQGRGYGHEAASALLDLAFDQLGLHRVYGRTDARNASSARLMQRLGMRQEAHLVHNEIFKGEWADELVFAILDTEWRARRSRTDQPG
jgi:RimJ/RimL family protein N-acetyltransferase